MASVFGPAFIETEVQPGMAVKLDFRRQRALWLTLWFATRLDALVKE